MIAGMGSNSRLVEIVCKLDPKSGLLEAGIKAAGAAKEAYARKPPLRGQVPSPLISGMIPGTEYPSNSMRHPERYFATDDRRLTPQRIQHQGGQCLQLARPDPAFY